MNLNPKRLLIVARKELIDLLRDRKSIFWALFAVSLSGPLVLGILYIILSTISERVDRLTIPTVHIEAAPDLQRHLERRGIRIDPIPPDAAAYEARLHNGELDAVLVIPNDYGERLRSGRTPTLTLVTLTSRSSAGPIAHRIEREINTYTATLGAERLILRGISPSLAQPLALETLDLSTPEQRGAQILQLMSFYALFAGLMGAIAAALDVTAGERERQTLEPLLTSAVTAPELALGKWLAVGAINLLAVTTSLAGFMLSLQFIPIERLGLPFNFGLNEFSGFMAVLIPFAFMVPAILLMFGAAGKTAKEAQSSLSIAVTLVGMLPLISFLRQDKAPWWDVWIPVNGQYAVLSKILRAEPIPALDWVAMWLIPVLLCLIALIFLSRRLGDEKMLAGR